MESTEQRTWRVVRTADGSPTALHPLHGQAAHDLEGARTEARERYVRPCRLDRVQPGQRVRLLDVGTGLGINVAAALEAAEARGGRLEAVGVELDPAIAALAADLPPDPDPGFEPAFAAVRGALGRAVAGERGPLAVGCRSTVELHLADARELIGQPVLAGPFDAVFADGFSPGVEPELWTGPFLTALAARLAPSGRLATYTASARVRAWLLAAGLEVALPPRCGRKGAGTVAGRALSDDRDLRPLEPRLAAKLLRRAARLAAGDGAAAGPPAGAAPGRGNPDGSTDDSTIIGSASCVGPTAGSTGLARRRSEA